MALPALAFLTAQIVLAAPPNASFTISDANPFRGQAISFDATATDDDGNAITSYEWDFGDGATGSGQNVSHAYSGVGTKSVTLTVTDSANETRVVTDQVTVENRLPTASFSVSDSTPARGQLIGFDATASDPDGDTLSYQWNFGDGATATGPNVSRAYPASTSLGAKTVTLTVTDSANGTTAVTQQLTVQNAPPTASFTISDTTPVRGQTVSFDATATDPDGSITSYQWNFGDGTTASGQNVTHAYNAASALGAKTVTLTVTDSNSETTVVTGQLTVQNAPPTATFTVSDTTPDRGQAVSFDVTATDPDGDITSYRWNFGDGTTSDGQDVSHAYPANTTLGVKTVTLTVTDGANQTAVVTHQLTVQNAPPKPAFTVSDPTPDIGQTVSFNGSASSDFEGAIADTDHDWDLDGDGSFERTGKTQTASYTTPGPVTVRLQVTDSNGAKEVATQTITVNANVPPSASFTVSHVDQAGGTPGVDVGETVNFDGSASSAGEQSDSISKYEWDLDGNGSFETTGRTASRSYSAPGAVPVTLRVTDARGATDSAAQTVTVGNTPPTARFTISPVHEPGGSPGLADVGETVNFSGSSSSAGEPSDTITKYEWDLDGNGTFETTGQNASRSYATAGAVDVRLRVTDGANATHVASTPDLRVNARPVARIGILNPQAEPGQTPAVPLAGQPFQFTAGAVAAIPGAPPAPGCQPNTGSPASPASNDLEGPLAAYHWDLDGNGEFNDATGQTAAAPAGGFDAGLRTVGLRVIDSDGAGHSTTLTFRVNRPPTPAFVLEPSTPVIGQQVTFSTTSNDPDAADGSLTHSWDLDADGSYCEAGEQGTTANRVFTTPGHHTIKLRVTDTGGITREVTRDVLVQNTVPTGSIAFSPEAPLPGQSVTFDGSGSSPSGKTIASLEWNLDFDAAGFDPATDEFVAQATGASVAWSFATAGPRTVALKISEVGGGFHIVTRTIVVNAPPEANFSISDRNPFTGAPVALSSISQDPDGPLAGQEWDLDNDGQFDDAAGAVAFATFARPGSHTVSLRVTDSKGASATAAGVVTVRVVPPPPSPPPPKPPELLQGVVIRIKGSVLGLHTKVRRLQVRAPKGANVLVRCRGKSCPKKASQASQLSMGRQLRFKQLERRMRAGTRIIVQVTKPGFVGRVTRFSMRKGAAPKRADLCLPPGAKAPTSCPGW